MKFVVKKYYSGYCSYEIEAKDKDQAYERARENLPKYDEILGTLQDWEECNEIESVGNA